MQRQPTTQLWIHSITIITAFATLLLIIMGGLVTSKGVGLVVPDWPTTFGHNLFLFPWSKMVGGVFYEHAHRLIGSAVGILTMILAVLLFVTEEKASLRLLGVAAALLVCLQGILGGLRVLLTDQTLAIAHACLAPAFFAVSVSLVLFTSPGWGKRWVEPAASTKRYTLLSVLTTALIYFQIILGAVLRHTGFGLELHLLAAGIVVIQVVLFSIWLLRDRLYRDRLGRPMKAMLGLLVLQLLLGLGSYIGRFSSGGTLLLPMFVDAITVGHVVTGGLMLANSILVTLYLFPADARSPSNEAGLAARSPVPEPTL